MIRVHTFDDLFHFVSFRFVPFRFVPFRVLSLASVVVSVYCILYISLHFFLEPIFYLPKYSLSEVYFNRDRLLIEFNGLWYSLAARQVFAAIANPDSLSFG